MKKSIYEIAQNYLLSLVKFWDIRLNKNNEPVISFGKYRDKTISEIYDTNPGYFSWINNAEFPRYTKKVLKELVNTYKLKKKFEN